MSGDILDDIDAAIEEHEGYVEWHGSSVSATWAADGSHEVDTGGRYYGDDSRPVDREVFDPSWVRWVFPHPFIESVNRAMGVWDETWSQIRYSATVTPDGSISWHNQPPPDPAEALRDVVLHWTATEAPPVRPIEAVLRDIVREQG